jgi:hypothetical protein
METIVLVLRIEIWCFLIGLATIVFYGMLIGAINTKGLLHDKGTASGFSPGRLQLLISTTLVAFYYIGQAFSNKNTGQFPKIPTEMLLILGGSHTFYLGSKTVSLLLETLGSKRPEPKTVKETNSNGNS